MTVSEHYLHFKSQITELAKNCGRDPLDITLVAVTKTHPVEYVMAAYHEGCRDFGESKVQEAEEKIGKAAEGIRWHLIGTLQKNKVRKVVGKFHLIHSIDSVELATKLSMCSEEEGVVTSVLLQVNTSQEVSKHGFSPPKLKDRIEELVTLKGITIKGLMTMAPFVEEETIIRACFRNLRQLRNELQQSVGLNLKELSMGMSQDYRIAIEEGATLLRIGTAIFGDR